jgi:hypothetical protein
MKIAIIVLMTLFGGSQLLAAENLARGTVQNLKGKVSVNGKTLKKGDIVSTNGLLKTGARSFVRILINGWNGQITLGGNTQMILNFQAPKDEGKYQLLSGASRWKTLSGKKSKGGMSGSVASLGVRGTDFFIINNKLFNETEIIVFDGAVEMENLSNKKDVKVLKKGQWGGVGGRFGANIGKVINLPANILETFKKKLSE